MSEKFIVINYDRDELISMIREVSKEELKERMKQFEKEIEYNLLLNTKEVAERLRVPITI